VVRVGIARIGLFFTHISSNNSLKKGTTNNIL
jgi:hypothetical protein